MKIVPTPFKTEVEARAFARTVKANISIIYSSTPLNKRGDYFVEQEGGMIRNWEKMIYEGPGKKA